tara:strand:+ start:38 stop:511 length:474 start_codon:yes stop_codon:yes gene_type:complete
MEVQGAGGSGASYDPHTSGSGGGYAKKLLDVSSISTSTITVGSGGASVSAGGGAGNAGGDTSWADGTNTITGSGGLAGPASATTILGGSATGGDININGGVAVGYYGGKSFLGLSWGQDQASPDPVGYGAGGASGATRGAYASHVGGDGIVVVWEYK